MIITQDKSDMYRPHDIPKDIWDTAWDHTDTGELSFLETVEIVSRAILIEREACANMAELVGIPMASNGAVSLMIPVKIADRIRNRNGKDNA